MCIIPEVQIQELLDLWAHKYIWHSPGAKSNQ